MITSKNLSIDPDKCEFIIQEKEGNKYLTISYTEEINFNTDKCLEGDQ